MKNILLLGALITSTAFQAQTNAEIKDDLAKVQPRFLF